MEFLNSIDPRILAIISFAVIIIVGILLILSILNLKRALTNISKATKNIDTAFTSMLNVILSIEELRKLSGSQTSKNEVIPTKKKKE
jgi:hypothetical protein